MNIPITNFQGEYPRVGRQQLPQNAASFTSCPRLLSENLTAWRDLQHRASLCKGPTINSIYLMADQHWLHWTPSELGAGQTAVNAVKGPIAQDTTERTIFTGTDVPRLTNLALATTGAGCMPKDSYKLGVPAPDTAPTLVVNAPTVVEGGIGIDNGDAENGTILPWLSTGDFSVFDATDIPGLLPYEGNYFFGGGSSASTEAYQLLDAATTGITAGQNFSISWGQAAGANGSKVRLELTFYDDAAVAISTFASTDETVAPANSWVSKTLTVPVVPDGTDSVEVRFIFTRVGGGTNDAYIDSVTGFVTNLGLTYDGSSFDGWNVYRSDNSLGTIDVNGSEGWPAPAFEFTSIGRRMASIYRNINMSTSPTTTIEFEYEGSETTGFNRPACVSLVLGASAAGIGTSLRFNSSGVTLASDTSWTTKSATTGQVLGDAPNDFFAESHFKAVVKLDRSGSTTMACTVTTYDMGNGGAMVFSNDFNITTYGGYVGFKGYADSDGSGRGVLDNIKISVTAPKLNQQDGEIVTVGANSNLFVQYVYTFVNILGEEGPPSPVSRIVQFPSGGSITVSTATSYPDSEYAITKKRIYRTATSDGVTSFLFVDELDLATDPYEDDTQDADLGEELQTVDWDLPPSDGAGVIALPNGVTAMFSKNQLCPSVINRSHAYPIAYRLNFDEDVVAIAAIDTSIVVGTRSYPYVVMGSDPAQMSSSKLEQRQACVSRRSMVSIRNYGVIYASPDGLVAVSGAGRLQLITDPYMSRREWQALNPSSIIAFEHDDRYFGFYTAGSTQRGFIFDPREGGNGLTFLDFYARAGYSDPVSDTLFLFTSGAVYAWDSHASNFRTYTWRSKEFQLPRAANFRAAQIRGTLTTPITFKYYSDGSLVYTKTVTDEHEFVLPAYDSTMVQVEVSGTAEIRLIQIAEDMDQLQ